MKHGMVLGLFTAVLVLMAASTVSASDGPEDTENAYPAVGVYFVAARYAGEPLIAEGYCSGTLIAEDLFLTASHCTFYDTRRFVEEPAYESADAWVSFNRIALNNDFWCHLQEIDYPGSDDLVCDEDTRTVPHPTFHAAVNTGVSHPDYPSIHTLGNGSLSIHEPVGPSNPDVAVLVLEEPITDITPLATAPLDFLDDRSLRGAPVVGVGYGLNYHKASPPEPNQPGGDGPTVFQGDFGVRRIADVGTVRSITPARIVPTQQSALGEDAVCYGDSGSPLFLVQDGVVDQTVVGVLTGGALWCMGSWDPYWRVDHASSVDFLDCVRTASTAQAACECGIEGSLGLCDDL